MTIFYTFFTRKHSTHKTIKRYLPSRGLQHERLIFPPAIVYYLLTIDSSTIWSDCSYIFYSMVFLTYIPWYYSSRQLHIYSYVLR